ncbi:MAG: AAA family ATPase [Lentisphaerota bacterium]
MIKEIYIDNFRCFSNFRINPGKFQLWLGSNGSGKTSVLEALIIIKKVLSGQILDDEIIKKDSLTIWDKRAHQRFGITLEIDKESYEYEIVLEYEKGNNEYRINKETLKWKKDVFFNFDGNEVHLYRINRSTKKIEDGAHFSADWRRSVISGIGERDDNLPLTRFREEIRKILIICPNPALIEQVAKSEDKWLSKHAENFPAWYRHLIQEKPEITSKAQDLLKEVLPGFEFLKLVENGDMRRLMAQFKIEDVRHSFDFINLSDGQRQLIVIYMIVEALRQKMHTILFIDEPENFVSLREIQPWLKSLEEVCEEKSVQSIIISHHPEIINDMAHGSELWFSRQNGAQVITRQFPEIPGLTPAETVARGWEENEQ